MGTSHFTRRYRTQTLSSHLEPMFENLIGVLLLNELRSKRTSAKQTNQQGTRTSKPQNFERFFRYNLRRKKQPLVLETRTNGESTPIRAPKKPRHWIETSKLDIPNNPDILKLPENQLNCLNNQTASKYHKWSIWPWHYIKFTRISW